MTDDDLKLYRSIIADRDYEIRMLRWAVVRYGDRIRMATVEPQHLQQIIDDAFENEPDQGYASDFESRRKKPSVKPRPE